MGRMKRGGDDELDGLESGGEEVEEKGAKANGAAQAEGDRKKDKKKKEKKKGAFNPFGADDDDDLDPIKAAAKKDAHAQEPKAGVKKGGDDGDDVPRGKGKGKGKTLASAFAALGMEDDESDDGGKPRGVKGKGKGGAKGSFADLLEASEGEEEGVASKAKGGAKAKGGFAALDSDEEGQGEAAAGKGANKGGKGGKKAKGGFAALDDDDEEVAEAELPAKADKKGGKKARSGFAALDDEDEEEAAEAEAPAKAADKGKGGKKAKGGFAALDDEDDEAAEAEPPAKVDKSKGGKKAKGGFAALDDDDEEAAEPPVKADKKGGKKGKGGFADLEEEEPETEPPAKADKKGGKKGKKAKGGFAALDDEDEEEAAEAQPPAKADKKAEKKGKKAKGGFAALDDDEDESAEQTGGSKGAKSAFAELAEEDDGGAKDDKGKVGKKDKKGKGKGKKGGADDHDDIDALVEQLDGPGASKKGGDKAGDKAGDRAGNKGEDVGEGAGGSEVPLEERDPVTLSKAQKKKLLAKKKAAEAAAGGGATAAPAEAEAEGDGEDKKGKSAAPKGVAAKIAAEMERRRKEEEDKRRAEEERKRQEEEEKRLEEERKRLEEEERERKRQEAKERREQLRREGKLLTGRAKEKADRMAALREQILGQVGQAGAKDVGPRKVETLKERQKRLAEEKRRREEAQRAAEEGAAAEEGEAAESRATSTAEAAAPASAEAESAPSSRHASAQEAPVAAPAAAVAEEEDEESSWRLREPLAEDWEEHSVSGAATSSASSSGTDSSSGSDSESDSGSSDSSDSDSDSDSSYTSSSDDSDESSDDEAQRRMDEAKARREARRKAAMERRNADDLRSPICCILGHVDTGKTKILDNIRRTNVQEGEAGGITQQIGATYVPAEAIQKRTEELRAGRAFKMRVPGLLVIDTPGHESFSNLRSRGSGLCDIAVLVVDLMHGLEQQTRESIKLLRMRKTPFIIALNKVDRLYGWEAKKDAPIRASFGAQKQFVEEEFRNRYNEISLQLNAEGLNVALYWENPDPRRYANVVPTSAITGEGLPDLMQLLVKLTQDFMSDRLMFCEEVQCTVLEVKKLEGLGSTVDVVLVNGRLKEGDRIVCCGLTGAIATNIRALLTPQPLKELRVKSQYVHHKEIRAAQGVKIVAPGLEGAIAGTELYVVVGDDDEAELMRQVNSERDTILTRIDRSGEGVCVQASTLGSMEALLDFLSSDDVKIPVSGIALGPIHKKDVMRASIMLERRPELAVILAFDVHVTREAQEYADSLGVRIFTADIIYHLFDQFKAYIEGVKEERRAAAAEEAVFPCRLKILEQYIFNQKDPIVLGVEVVDGVLRKGTPICVPAQNFVSLGKVASMEKEKRELFQARKGDQIAVKIAPTNAAEQAKMYGRHFTHVDELVSRISRRSIDLLKENFRDQMEPDDWKLVMKLKKVFLIE